MQQPQASFLFDLDGTLVDSVYQHVLAWNEALDAEGIKLSVWRIHRKIGMSGGLLTNMLLRETGLEIDSDRIERLQRLHAQAYIRQSAKIQPLPGAHDGLRPEEWACAPHLRRKIYLASLLVIDAGTPRCVVQRAARSLRVSTRGTARGGIRAIVEERHGRAQKPNRGNKLQPLPGVIAQFTKSRLSISSVEWIFGR
jgi:hypothetical protein